ncbi:MAG: hypothetical protein ACXAEU_12130, partial [Candidatus Hodarchaeales archaeon]
MVDYEDLYLKDFLDNLDKLASFLEKREITSLSLNAVEAKELVLNHFGLRGISMHEKLSDELHRYFELRNIFVDVMHGAGGDELKEYASLAEQFKSLNELPPSNFRDFTIFPKLGYVKGKISGRGGERNPIVVIPISMEVENVIDDARKYVLDHDRDHTISPSNAKQRIRSTLEILAKIFYPDWVISKLTTQFNVTYDNAISLGQANAAIKRVMGIPLTSTERSHLHELRKKIGKYKRLIEGFEDSVQVKKRVPLASFPLREELTATINKKNRGLKSVGAQN